MNKSEAAAFLGVSEKTIQNYIKKGRLNVKYVPGKTSPIADFNADEVESLKVELAAIVPKAGKIETANIERGKVEDRSRNIESKTALAIPASSFSNNSIVSINIDDLPALAQALVNTLQSGQSVPTISLADKPLLTLSEAAIYTGISEHTLRKAVKANEIATRRIGRSDRVLPGDLRSWIQDHFKSG